MFVSFFFEIRLHYSARLEKIVPEASFCSHNLPRNFLLVASKTVRVTTKSKQQAKVKLEAHITARQLAAQLSITMFPQFSRATIFNKVNQLKKWHTFQATWK